MKTLWMTDIQNELPDIAQATESFDLKKHSHDASSHPGVSPDVVLYPNSVTQVSKIMKFAYERNLCVTPFAAGTSLEGNPIPVKKGIIMDLMRMNRILHIFEKDFQVTVEPGILGDDLNKKLALSNLFFPAFPASSHIASVGGMIANNAGGMYAISYGVVGNWVLKLEVVLADGRIIETGSRSIKSVAGYDLTSLFVGSEGTLGVITKATVRLIPTISSRLICKIEFKTIEDAVEATVSILHANLNPAAVEFLDSASIAFVNKMRKSGWAPSPTLIIEFHGINESLIERRDRAVKIARTNHSVSFEATSDVNSMKEIWDIRKAVHPAIMASNPNAGILSGDIGIPISQIPSFMKYVSDKSKDEQLSTSTFGHVGDGNFHVWIVYDKFKSETLDKAKYLNRLFVLYALSLGGTCTAEHGIGIGKREFLKREHENSLFLMEEIKKIFDPRGILNPGKIFL